MGVFDGGSLFDGSGSFGLGLGGLDISDFMGFTGDGGFGSVVTDPQASIDTGNIKTGNIAEQLDENGNILQGNLSNQDYLTNVVKNVDKVTKNWERVTPKINTSAVDANGVKLPDATASQVDKIINIDKPFSGNTAEGASVVKGVNDGSLESMQKQYLQTMIDKANGKGTFLGLGLKDLPKLGMEMYKMSMLKDQMDANNKKDYWKMHSQYTDAQNKRSRTKKVNRGLSGNKKYKTSGSDYAPPPKL